MLNVVNTTPTGLKGFFTAQPKQPASSGLCQHGRGLSLKSAFSGNGPVAVVVVEETYNHSERSVSSTIIKRLLGAIIIILQWTKIFAPFVTSIGWKPAPEQCYGFMSCTTVRDIILVPLLVGLTPSAILQWTTMFAPFVTSIGWKPAPEQCYDFM